MKKDYYGILKISRRATPESIKKAYRKAAKRHHPDISPEDDEKFKEIQEAYETLSDPAKKGRYDSEISSRPHSYKRSYSPETFIHFFDPLGLIFSDPGGFFIDDFTGFSALRSQGSRQYDLEIALTPKEAKEGCRIPLSVPIMRDCSRCSGSGRIKGLICGLCRGRGITRSEERISLTIPPNAKDGSIMKVSVEGPGGSATNLRIVLRVQKMS